MEKLSYLSISHSDTVLALSFLNSPGSKKRKDSKQQRGHQKDSGSQPCQQAWFRRYSGQFAGFHRSDRIWQKQAPRGNTLSSAGWKFSCWQWLTRSTTGCCSLNIPQLYPTGPSFPLLAVPSAPPCTAGTGKAGTFPLCLPRNTLLLWHII